MRPDRFLSRLAALALIHFLLVSAIAAQTSTSVDLTSTGSNTSATEPATTLTTLVNFGVRNGQYPNGFLGQATDGNVYSTTLEGGGGVGTVFKMAPSGALTTLYGFGSQSGDGKLTYSGLVQGVDGNFYGVNSRGGSGQYSTVNSGGDVFTITPQGKETVLYSFCGLLNCRDGSSPYAGLVQGIDRNFYGTTLNGGTRGVCTFGCGVVFKMTPQGTLTTLHTFCSQTNCTDGYFPGGSVTQASDGNFYGTTIVGGASVFCSDTEGCGTIFKISSQGVFSTLYNFCSQTNCTDGFSPRGTLLQAADGNLYGVTFYGAATSQGTIFKITLKGVLTAIHTFCALPNCTDGSYPSSLIQGNDGNFYGTTTYGGVVSCDSPIGGCGTFFKVASDGTLTTLYTFCTQGSSTCPDGAHPGAIVQGTDGNFYGVTNTGGATTYGTAFKISVGLGPFVETQTSSGAVGSSVVILGTNLIGSTSVTSNGTAAAFTVVSSSEIKATIPNGATTGPVVVTTPNGALKSNKKFRIAL